MVSSLFYRRPPHISSLKSKDSSIGSSDMLKSQVSNDSELCRRGIPDALSFERVMDGGTCPPCTVTDFVKYLHHVEHGAENIQFYIWYKDYLKRFSNAPSSEIILSPIWTQAMHASTIQQARKKTVGMGIGVNTTSSGDPQSRTRKPTPGVEEMTFEPKDPFITPLTTPGSNMTALDWSEPGEDRHVLQHMTAPRTEIDPDRKRAAAAFQAAGLDQPFTIQPFRQEINRILIAYLASGGARELNISGADRQATITALHYTTHPSAFHAILATIESTLRRQSHPNFIRWTIRNGNRPRVIFAIVLGLTLIFAGLITGILLTLAHRSRGIRAVAIVPLIFGFATLICAVKGMCVVLHGLHCQQVRPWDLFDGDVDTTSNSTTLRAVEAQKCELKSSFESKFSRNSYEDEPWIQAYAHRNVLRKILDRQFWVEEPALRQLQDTIALQALCMATAASLVLVVVFLVVPGGGGL